MRNEPFNDDPATEEEADEGGVTYRLHRHIERSAKLRRKKIDLARKVDPKLKCEVCSFSFVEVFGAAGDGFVEVHHTDPLHLPGRATATWDDLVSALPPAAQLKVKEFRRHDAAPNRR